MIPYDEERHGIVLSAIPSHLNGDAYWSRCRLSIFTFTFVFNSSFFNSFSTFSFQIIKFHSHNCINKKYLLVRLKKFNLCGICPVLYIFKGSYQTRSLVLVVLASWNPLVKKTALIRSSYPCFLDFSF